MPKIKFLHCCTKITDPVKDCLEEVPRRGGMYNWLFLFKGEILPYQYVDDFEKYDVIQVNMSAVDMNLIPEIRRKLGKSSSTMLVINNDYVAESWAGLGTHPLYYEQIQRLGDMVFGTEPYQTSCLIDGAFCMPHPHYVEVLKHVSIDEKDKESDSVAVMFHWWEGKTYLPALLIQKIKQQKRIFARIYGYREEYDDMKRWSKALWDERVTHLRYPDFIEHLLQNTIFIEPVQYHTYGRTTVDTAILGIPTVGSNRVFSMRKCFPYTSFDPVDIKGMTRAVLRLLEDEDFREKVVRKAKEQAEYFNYKNSKKRFLAALEMAQKGAHHLKNAFWVWDEKNEMFVSSKEVDLNAI